MGDAWMGCLCSKDLRGRGETVRIEFTWLGLLNNGWFLCEGGDGRSGSIKAEGSRLAQWLLASHEKFCCVVFIVGINTTPCFSFLIIIYREDVQNNHVTTKLLLLITYFQPFLTWTLFCTLICQYRGVLLRNIVARFSISGSVLQNQTHSLVIVQFEFLRCYTSWF